MIGLLRLLSTHSVELEASLRSEYGNECRLSNIYTGKMTLRELKMLVKGLPLNSMLKAKLSGDDEDQRWSIDTHILAATHDFVVNHYASEFYKAGSKPPFNPRDARIPRPGEKRAAENAQANAVAILKHLRGERIDPSSTSIDPTKVTLSETHSDVITDEEPNHNS